MQEQWASCRSFSWHMANYHEWIRRPCHRLWISGVYGLLLARQRLSACWRPKEFGLVVSSNTTLNSWLFQHERGLNWWVELLMWGTTSNFNLQIKTTNVILAPLWAKPPNFNYRQYFQLYGTCDTLCVSKDEQAVFTACVSCLDFIPSHVYSVHKNTKIHNFDYKRQFPAYSKTVPLVETHSPYMPSCRRWHHWMNACYALHNVPLKWGLPYRLKISRAINFEVCSFLR